MRLPTNPEMLERVRRLRGFRSGSEGVAERSGSAVAAGGDGGGGREGWRALLGPPGSHRMLYTLQIVDGVLDFVAGGGDGGGGRAGRDRQEAGAMSGAESPGEWEVRTCTCSGTVVLVALDWLNPAGRAVLFGVRV